MATAGSVGRRAAITYGNVLLLTGRPEPDAPGTGEEVVQLEQDAASCGQRQSQSTSCSRRDRRVALVRQGGEEEAH